MALSLRWRKARLATEQMFPSFLLLFGSHDDPRSSTKPDIYSNELQQRNFSMLILGENDEIKD